MPSSRSIRLYVRYKCHSRDLFREIVGEDLTGVQSWSQERLASYRARLTRGYLENAICYSARKEFKASYVSSDMWDEGHDKAILQAEENCRTYLALMEKLLRLCPREDHSQDSEDSSDGSSHGRDNGNREPQKSPAAKIGKYERHTAEEAAYLIEQWKKGLEDWAKKESEQERIVMELYEQSKSAMARFKVLEAEQPHVLAILVRLFAPTYEPVWEWSDKEVIAAIAARLALKKTNLDSDLEKDVLKAIVLHRKGHKEFSKGSSLICYVVSEDPSPLDTYTRDTALLLHMLLELDAMSIGGQAAHDVEYYSRIRQYVKDYRRTGAFPSALLLKSAPSPWMFDDREAPMILCKAHRIEEQKNSSMERKPVTGKLNSVGKGVRQMKAAIRSVLRGGGIFEPWVDVVIFTMWARAVEGTLRLDEAIVHPASFLRSLGKRPDDTLAARAHRLYSQIRLSGPRASDSMTALLVRVFNVTRFLFDLQYYEHFTDYMKTGHIPKEAAANDAFENRKTRAGSMLLAAEGKMSLPEFDRLRLENARQICIQADGGWKTM